MLAEALVALAQQQARRGDLRSPYLRRHLPRHATHAGPAGVAAVRRLAEADPDPQSYLPGLAVALSDFAAHLLAVGDHEVALIPAQEATDVYRQLTETSPEVYFTHLVASLTRLTCHLAALDRISAAVDLYTSHIETFTASPACRDALIIERAGFHLNHGDASTGLRELVTLLTLDDGQTPDAVMLAGRNVLRAHRLRDGAAVDRVWRAVTGTEPPDWLVLTPAQIGLVTEWITAPSWAESKTFYTAHAGELLDHPATVVLDELALIAAPRIELHRHLLNGVRERGLEWAYLPLLLRDLLTDWIEITDWRDSQSFAEEHAADLLTAEAEIALIHLGNPLATLVHLALLRVARRDGISAAYDCVADPATLEEFAEQVDPAERQRAQAEIADIIDRFPDKAALIAVLPEILISLNRQIETPGLPEELPDPR